MKEKGYLHTTLCFGDHNQTSHKLSQRVTARWSTTTRTESPRSPRFKHGQNWVGRAAAHTRFALAARLPDRVPFFVAVVIVSPRKEKEPSS